MRTIKFRGKMLENGFWKFGYYYVNQCGEHCIYAGDRDFIVIPESVGQFTGLLDKNGKEIYEGDIVKFYNVIERHSDLSVARKWQDSGEVWYSNKRYCFVVGIDQCVKSQVSPKVDLVECYDLEIIGNRFDNPELLK